MILVSKDRPRPDVIAAVVSTISTNTQPVKKYVFQAAVPKVSVMSGICETRLQFNVEIKHGFNM